ncbi:aminotransferase class I/II-fold pyridoxal phosphate-dependent enzyme [Brachybacterium sp. EF45031]|uniref:MalY/PatB family protein n=1 Tax=Brachybacterium sillae TaxID=2810536 RepID=UPI00217E80C7|nr:aminotransferase class I/II-fold pyridoxal phosphate-dependent enzyme [Brachybacterium sillae]MCS6711815.1 aminotransferase class I/II-fold pyridoxal phosphate-dependent enzyme [Brachybacterium sillae]
MTPADPTTAPNPAAPNPTAPNPTAPNPAGSDSAVPNPLTDLTLEELRRRTSVKWQRFGPDVLPLWVAEMDVRPAPAVMEALTAALRAGDTGYPHGRGYARAFADFARNRWGWADLDVEHTAQVTDVMTGITEVLRVLSDPGDAVVVTSPVYPPFFEFPERIGRTVLEAPLTAEGRLDPTTLADALDRARRHGPRPVLLLANPHNPTGTVHTRAELEQAVTLARQAGARVVADEIHAPLVHGPVPFTPLLTAAGAEDAVVVTSAAKGWNLPGLKAALVIAGPEATTVGDLPYEAQQGASHLAILAHTVALTSGREWLDALLPALADNQRLLRKLLAEHLPQVRYRPGEATYLAWLDCSALGLPGPADGGHHVRDMDGPARFFLEEAQVALNAGHTFGGGGEQCVRLNYATRPEILTEAVQRMGEAVRRRG